MTSCPNTLNEVEVLVSAFESREMIWLSSCLLASVIKENKMMREHIVEVVHAQEWGLECTCRLCLRYSGVWLVFLCTMHYF